MIRVKSISIKEFRGIRDLTLDFKGNNYAICGPNGTGKSGVVDALEFVLTGKVSRLSGEGSGDISLKRHGPHVDIATEPERAFVEISATIPSLNKTVTVSRTVKDAAIAKVTPPDSDVIEILKQVEMHPEFVLSRRELIRYVIATPGTRSEEVQALLHLDTVEKVRKGLRKIANKCERQLAPIKSEVAQAGANLLRALDIPELKQDEILALANADRQILGLTAIPEMTETTSLSDGIASPGPDEPQRISKAPALAEIQNARDSIDKLTSEPTAKLIAKILDDIVELKNDTSLEMALKRDSFYSMGLDLSSGDYCPYCDNAWDSDELKQHIQDKVDELEKVASKRKAAEKKLIPLISVISNVQSAVSKLIGYGTLLKPTVESEQAQSYHATCDSTVKKLEAFLPLDDIIHVLRSAASTPRDLIPFFNQIEKSVTALPDPSKQDAARQRLIIIQERLDVFRSAKRKEKIAIVQAANAKNVFDVYASTSDIVLTGIYDSVEQEFENFYRYINRDDEDEFKAKLIPSIGKLGFDVDFYGRGFFPPGAYHSEGHQDAMGLCLYLALMRGLQGDSFTFAVLDDVLMSIDAVHRREVCVLLKREFPNTQFILTTHDPIWLRHMKTEGLIQGRSAVQFRNWTVDYGPTQWDDRDVWTEIADHLHENDVRAAAGLLRHFLEYTSAELCHRLRAPVEYRGDAQYQLGELLPPAIVKMRHYFKKAKVAANSWNQNDKMEVISSLESQFSALADATNAEAWQLNVAVHYNSWENLGKDDFEPVAKAFQSLLKGFSCSECGNYLRVIPDRKTVEAVRCNCGHTELNLLIKG